MPISIFTGANVRSSIKENPEVYHNAMMPSQMVKEMCDISTAGKALLKTAMER